MQDIRDYIVEANYSEAIKRLEIQLQLNPDSADLQYLAGVAKTRAGDPTGATEHLSSCLESDPDHALAYVALGRAQRLQGQPVDAQAAFDTAIFLRPELAGAHALAGELAAFEGDREQATQRALSALHEGADDPQAPVVRAAMALQAGEAGTALDLLEPFVAAVNVGARVAQMGAAAHLMLGQFEPALEAIELVPIGSGVMPAAIRALQLRGLLRSRRMQAQQVARTFVEEHPDSADAWSMLAEMELLRGQFTQAIDAADRSLQLRPHSSQTTRVKAMTYLRASKQPVAEQVLGDQVAARPRDAKSWRMLLGVVVSSGQHDEAKQLAQRWIEATPEEADAHGDFASLLEFDGDYDGAMVSARAALRSQSGHINALLIAARAELRIGRPGPVITRLDRVHPSTLDLAQQVARLALLARAADANDDQELAVTRWVEKHNVDPSLQPAGSLVSVAATTVSAAQQVLKVSEPMPIVFLVGLPGSGVVEVAGALAKVPGVCLMGDRFSQQARNDGLARPDWDLLERGLGEIQATMFRRHWIKPLRRLNLPGKYQLLIDWLPHLDARLYAAIACAVPEAKFLVVEREPRDGLLDWLAFSGPHRLRFPALADAGQWYAAARSHALFAVNDRRLPSHLLPFEQAGNAGVQLKLLQWLGLDATSLELEPPLSVGGVVSQFPAGHAQNYLDEMSPAFQALGKT